MEFKCTCSRFITFCSHSQHFFLSLFLSLTPANSARSPPTSKRVKTSATTSAPPHLLAQQQIHPFHRVPAFEGVPIPTAPIPSPQTTTTSRKRPASPATGSSTMMAAPMTPAGGAIEADPNTIAGAVETTPKKKGRTNTPWTAEEEQRLKTMRDAGRSWSEIAKVRTRVLFGQKPPSADLDHFHASQTFPTRTEGSVKKHWYKVWSDLESSDMAIVPLTYHAGHALC